MVLGIYAAVAVLSAVGVCWGTGGFETLTWLWLLPVSFVGAFLCLLILTFLLVTVMSLPVKMDKQQEKDSPLLQTRLENWQIRVRILQMASVIL